MGRPAALRRRGNAGYRAHAPLSQLFLATGHAMIGLALAPITGRLIAELLAGELPAHDLARFAPDRF